MSTIRRNEPLAIEVTAAIHQGDLETLNRLLRENPGLATSWIVPAAEGDRPGGGRSLLHIVTDWPGHFPNGPATVAALVEAGADVNAGSTGGQHEETPLHWAASSDDVAVLDALLDRGADIEAPGAVIGGGTALADAVAFGQWKAARRLIERGARSNLWQSAALGLMDRVRGFFSGDKSPPQEDLTNAFWCACHGGQREPAEYLLDRGADLNWIGYNELTPLDTAARANADELVKWLQSRGAKSRKELR